MEKLHFVVQSLFIMTKTEVIYPCCVVFEEVKFVRFYFVSDCDARNGGGHNTVCEILVSEVTVVKKALMLAGMSEHCQSLHHLFTIIRIQGSYHVK